MKNRRFLVTATAVAIVLAGIGYLSFRQAYSSGAPQPPPRPVRTLGAPLPGAPAVTEPRADGHLVSGADVHMESAPMPARKDGKKVKHVCTEWEIWSVEPAERVWHSPCVDGPQLVHAHLGDGEFENSFAARRDLAADREYDLRLRYRDDSKDKAKRWSPWGYRAFRTLPQRAPLAGAGTWHVRQDGYRVEEVAGGFQLPVHLAMAPGHTGDPAQPMFYVTELYGQIKVVKGDLSTGVYAKNLLNFNPRGTFPGTGEKGVTGIVVDPNNGDVLASVLYERGGVHYPKVVRFSSKDGGLTAAKQTTLLDMPAEAQSAAHQISQLTIGPDGKLYVHMGDAMLAYTAKDLNSFRGKILRVNLDGSAPADNPFYDAEDGITARDYVYASGFRNPFGGAWRADGSYYQVENGTAIDRLSRVDKGVDYGWDGTRDSMLKPKLHIWSPSTAPTSIAFVDPDVHHGSGFPKGKYGHMFVAESGPTFASGPQDNGKRIVEFTFDGGKVGKPKTLLEYNGTGKATVVGLAAGPDGLYFTALYPDADTAAPDDPNAKIYRVRYTGAE
ncbi:PQQ-dependent sugar dehydrogenase [Catellatospora citrea]|uniref:PQQ-dependent sugar dehydrogenase n=1 Tax=Catellatospora citrea TaxID=53366 RepID=UPI0033D28FD1